MSARFPLFSSSLTLPVAALAVAAVLALGGCARQSRQADEADAQPTRPAPGAALQAEGSPPAYSASHLIELPAPSGASVRVGIDPETIEPDARAGVVSYVVILRGISAQVAQHEAIRCNGGQWRTLARQQPGEPWRAAGGDWQDIYAHAPAYARTLARDGLCLGPALNADRHAIVRGLRTGGRHGMRLGD